MSTAEEDPYVRERILNLALEVSASASMNQILTLVLSRIDELLDFDLASIALLENNWSILTFREMNYRVPGHGGTRSDVGRQAPMVEDNVFGWVALTGRPHLRRSLNDAFPFERLQSTDELDSHIIVPIIGRREVLGILAVGGFREDLYDEVDMAMASQYARLTGLAIDNLKTYRQVSDLALKDGLTGSFNHRHFQDMLSREIQRLERYGGELSLMLMDVDNFKRFNDRYGHPEGDQVLKQTARLLQKSLRGSDTVFRYGGEEFAVLLPGTGLSEAKAAGEKLIQTMRRENHYRKGSDIVPVTASAGVASTRGSEKSRETLLAQADVALYQAKGEGKDRVAVHPEG